MEDIYKENMIETAFLSFFIQITVNQKQTKYAV